MVDRTWNKNYYQSTTKNTEKTEQASKSNKWSAYVGTSIQLPILTKHITSDGQEDEEDRNIVKGTQREVQSRFK